jgi:hypothetical protein
MPRKANPRETVSALDRLGPEEAARLLPQLLKGHPELRTEIEALALKLITTVDPEEVADDLEFEFSGIHQEEIWDRSGSDSYGGYTAPDEAAGQLCEEALAPFLKDLSRLLSMGQADPALAQVKGMILGLHNLKGQLPPDAEDYPSDSGLYEVLETWVEGRPVVADKPLLAWVAEVLPDWRQDVAENLEHIRKRAANDR